MAIEFFELLSGKKEDQEIREFFDNHKITKWETVVRIGAPPLLVIEYVKGT